jgi:hypothetical protein
MKFRIVLAAIAALCAALTFTPVRAASIEILQVHEHGDGMRPFIPIQSDIRTDSAAQRAYHARAE